jgi:hypothetical protein
VVAAAPTAKQFKNELRFRAARLEEIASVLPDGKPVVATVKVDGELVVWDVDVQADQATLVNQNDRERDATMIRRSLIDACKAAGLRTARGAGELYAVDRRGRPLPLGEVMSLVKRKQIQAIAQPRLRLAVFDVFAVDGKQLWGKTSYADRYLVIQTLFGQGTRVRPVVGQRDVKEPDPLKHLWRKHVLERGFEGLVIRVNHAVKIKPIHTVDLAVIGIQEGTGKKAGMVGALATAFRDRSGRYLWAGKVGTGLTDDESREWWELLRPLRTGDKLGRTKEESRIDLVRPVYVIEAMTHRFNERQVSTWRWDPKAEAWGRSGRRPGVVLQGPARYVRRRDDKTTSPMDLRLEQVPGWTITAAEAVIPSPEGDGAAFGRILVDLRPDLARFGRHLGIPDEYLEDVIQQTQLKALESWNRLEAAWPEQPKGTPRPGERLQPWLFRVLANAWKDLAEKESRRLFVAPSELEGKRQPLARRRLRANPPGMAPAGHRAPRIIVEAA